MAQHTLGMGQLPFPRITYRKVVETFLGGGIVRPPSQGRELEIERVGWRDLYWWRRRCDWRISFSMRS